MAALLRRASQSQSRGSLVVTLRRSFAAGFSPQVRSVVSSSGATGGFDEMVAANDRKYYMVGGKGGVGKTSCAASLAVKFANHGHPTIVVSTDPAHSLSDSFAQINPEKSREEFRTASQKNSGGGIKDLMESMGLGAMVDQLGDLKLDELLDTPPPGLDEAISISKVMQFVESPEYSNFTRVVFDTAPTGHTLRLLSLPDFLDASLGKMMKLKKKLASATAAIKSVFGKQEEQKDVSDKLDQLRERMRTVRDLFRDSDMMEFIIVTIPAVMAISESSRLCASLRKESVPVQRLIVNQVLPQSVSECRFCSVRRKDQLRALDMIKTDPELARLSVVEAPLFDAEIRGVPALKFMGNMIWK
ncbi:ATPase GET3B-like isoform X2 [Syzygium oleosum]|uniref:ATPase GET3B-like isoform X2 n=1 Tax=Syzygium oleosum TaxID=219896 RepID=UPI0024B9EDC3|nr:ATPase GET3B-like isoform X2 [Syzygium oleosum]